MRLTVRAGAALSGAVGAWFALGAVAIAPGATVAWRVGVLPPWWVLGALVAAFAGLVFGLRFSVARATPLFAAWLCALPWVPGEVPAAALAWQGLLAGVLWTGIAVAVVAAEPVAAPGRWRASLVDPARAPWLAVVLAAVVFGVSWRGTAVWLPGGDEPHYLVITQSLLADGDLRIEDNHQRREYLAYFPGELKPDYLRRGADGQIYSIHAPGVSALVAPAFLAGGYVGAALFILVCCALGTGLAWRVAWEVTGEAGAAWFGWATLAFAVPVVAHAYTIYPDGLSGVLVVVGMLAFVRAHRAERWPLICGGTALALLPWLHTRNAVIAAGLGLAIVIRAWRHAPPGRAARRLVDFLAVPLVSAAAWFGSFKAIYGTFDPSAPYGGYTQSSLANVLRGVPGLLVDQQFGALATAPVLWAAVIGTLALARGAQGADGQRGPGEPLPSPRALAAMLAAAFVPYLLVTASYHMWWGGTSAPARFLVPVLWTAALPAAAAWQRGRAPADRAIWLGLLALTAALTVVMSYGQGGLLTFTTRAQHGPLQEWATRAVDLSLALPSLLRDTPWLALEQATVWGAALLAWWLALRVVGTSPRAAAAWAVPLAVASASAALGVAWQVARAEPQRVDASRRAVIDAAWLDGLGLVYQRVTIDGRRWRSGVTSASGVLPLLELGTMARGRPPAGQLLAIAGLPAGDYRVSVNGAIEPAGRVRLEVGRGGLIDEHVLAELPRGSGSRLTFDAELPVAVDALRVLAADGVPPGTSATITPLRLRPRDELASADPALVARRYPGADAFFTTDGQYPERDGIWVKAGAGVPVVVRPHKIEAARVPVFVRNGPLPNTVALEAEGWRETLTLAPGQEVSVDWPWPAGANARLLRVSAATPFRPVDVDPASQDFRRLGVWIEFRNRK